MLAATTKFHSIVLSTTTLIVFTLWARYGNVLPVNPYLKVIVAYFLSLGLYQYMAKLFVLLFGKVRLIRKLLLGAEYLEGTWIGYYIGLGGEVRFVIEYFEQDLNGLIIRGYSFTANRASHTSWTSYPANIDATAGLLTAIYIAQGVQTITRGEGIICLSFVRKNKKSAPEKLHGSSADLTNNEVKRVSLQYKYSDSNDIKDNKVLLDKAEAFYMLNK